MLADGAFLTAERRRGMLARIDERIADGVFEVSDYVKVTEQINYTDLLRTAVAQQNAAWLANQLIEQGILDTGRFKQAEDMNRLANNLARAEFDSLGMAAIVLELLADGKITTADLTRVSQRLTSPPSTPTFDPKERSRYNSFVASLKLHEPYRSWARRWCAALLACQRHGGDARALQIRKRATQHQVAQVESKLGHQLPWSLRQAFLNFSAGFEFSWFLPENAEVPFREIYSGGFEEIGLDSIIASEESRKKWIERAFRNPNNPYDAVWHNKLAFTGPANGDLIAIDRATDRVVYLSHDGHELHGKVLGVDFTNFMDHWSRLGCVGPAGWEIQPFVAEGDNGIDSHGISARKWRFWFGMRV